MRVGVFSHASGESDLSNTALQQLEEKLLNLDPSAWSFNINDLPGLLKIVAKEPYLFKSLSGTKALAAVSQVVEHCLSELSSENVCEQLIKAEIIEIFSTLINTEYTALDYSKLLSFLAQHNQGLEEIVKKVVDENE